MAVVSITEYAKLKGLDPRIISKRIKRGVISKKSLIFIEGSKIPRIDSERADLDMEFNVDQDRAELNEEIEDLKNEEAQAKLDEEVEQESSSFEKNRLAKLDTEMLRAEKLRMEVEEKKKVLLKADEVRNMIAKLVGETREAILTVPSKVAPVLIAIKDPVEFESRLLKELNEALMGLSKLSEPPSV